MTKRWDTVMMIGLLLAVALSLVVGFDAQCHAVRQGVLRFHVLANSDSEEDQALKLAVRDAVLQRTAECFAAADSLTDAETAAAQYLPEMKTCAEETLRAAGCSDAVQVKMVNMYFETRTYGERTLPAGCYDAVRIEIGEAAGQNWWCVMFPPLCIGTAADSAELQAIDALGEGVEYRLSFAAVEWLEALLAKIRK